MRWWIPETIGTSAMDCGPAALASLLRGFGIGVAYDRLREALCTDVDGTSIDRLEAVAEALGLDAEQVMLPADVVALPAAAALPAVVVTRLPEGALHFVVVWRRVGAWVQVMDPAVGRRWMRVAALVRQLHRHGVALPAAAWRAWAGSAAHGRIVAARLGALGVRGAAAAALVARAEADPGFGAWAALDAAIRVVGPLVAGGGVRRGREAAAAIGGLMGRVGFGAGAVALPPGMWSVMPLPGEGEPWVEMQGAVLVRVKRRARGGSVTDGMGAIDGMDAADDIPTADGMGATNAIPAADAINAINGMTPDDTPANDAASADIAARGGGPGRTDDALGRLGAPGALAAPTRPPLRTLLRMLLADGALAPGLIALALLVSTAVAVVEAALFRGLIDVVAWIGAPEQRLGALAAVLGFMLAALAIEAPAQAGMLRLGRGIELRLRSAFRHKLPRLGERYLRSRPLSDLAERAHGIDGVRALPGLVARVVLAAGGLACTAAGLVWLDPGLWPVVAGTVAVGLCVPLLTVPLLAERDLRFRTHAGALTRYAFDALMGLSAIRTHGGQRAMRRRHEQLLTEWAGAALSLERLALWVEGALAVAGALVVGWLLFDHLRRAEDTRGVLLLVWWGLALPGRARGLVEALQAWPGARNQALRVLEPLDAPAGEAGEEAAPRADVAAGAAIELRGVALRAGTLAILEDVDLTIAPGEHVAVVGRSGAGKSSLVGLLLGLNPPSAGALRVDGEPLVGGAIGRLRSETAWVDPAVQLWNRSLLDNLRYGQAAPIDPGALLDDAELRAVLARLPEGLQTRLGEGGGLVSGGEGQRVRVARAMARTAPRLVLLDEPFRGLDRPARRRLLARTRRRWPGATLLCVTHDLDETRGFDRVVVIEDGRIIEQGPPAALVAAGGRYAALLAREAEVDAAWRDARWLHRRLDGGRVVAADERAREAG